LWVCCRCCFNAVVEDRSFDANRKNRQVDGDTIPWISKEKRPPFEEAVLNWIVSTCKPFTCVERLSFRPERACGFAAGAVSTLWLKIVVSMQIERIGR
jgi:hypothetical protein